jgi:predicted RNA-binding Zn-ribbon protein involved in translation (DUF1610 family)
MCKKCKGCGKSNLGAIVTHIEKIAVRLVDGVVTEQFQDSYEESQTEEINYCFECGKEITEADLYEDVQCPICGKMVGGLTESGACQECTDEANKLASMSKEQLILMLMKQAHGGTMTVQETPVAPVTGSVVATQEGAAPVKDAAPKDEERIEVDTKYIEDSLKAKENAEVTESNEGDTTAPKKTRSRKKVEPADVTEDGVNEAKEEIIEKVDGVEVVEGADPNKIVDAENTAALTVIDDGNAVPVSNVNDDVDAILNELDKVDLENGGEIF